MESKLRPTFEKIDPLFGTSFFIDLFEEASYHQKPQWHFHPEYEIVYIAQGNGKRYIGDHMGHYENGELIFLGPNLPHLSYASKSSEVVLQLREDFLGSTFLSTPEMGAIKQLFSKSRTGLIFTGSTKHKIGQVLTDMVKEAPFERLLSLLRVLQMMATTKDYQPLNASGFAVEVNPQDKDRMEAIYHYVEENFQRAIPLEEMAHLINMTVPAFCRYFKKLTNRTFTQMVNEFRITYASRLLRDEHMSIASISFESGFNNLSHFNKQFKSITGKSPREYRKNLRNLVS